MNDVLTGQFYSVNTKEEERNSSLLNITEGGIGFYDPCWYQCFCGRNIIRSVFPGAGVCLEFVKSSNNRRKHLLTWILNSWEMPVLLMNLCVCASLHVLIQIWVFNWVLMHCWVKRRHLHNWRPASALFGPRFFPQPLTAAPSSTPGLGTELEAPFSPPLPSMRKRILSRHRAFS